MNRLRRWLTTPRIWAVGYLVVVLGMVSLFYSDAQQDAFDKKRGAEIAAAKAETIDCVFRVLHKDSESTQARAKAASQSDMALRQSKRAMGRLVELWVLEGVTSGPEVTQAAEQYVAQTRKFIKASRSLQTAREDNPPPDASQIEACK